MTDVFFEIECAREGLEPGAVRRLVDHLLRGGNGPDLHEGLFEEADAREEAAAKDAREEAQGEAEARHNDRCADALKELERDGDPRRAIVAAFNDLVMGCEDFDYIAGALDEKLDAIPDAPHPRLAFRDYIAARLGTDKWVLTPRLTAKMKARGYAVAIRQADYDAIAAEFDRLPTLLTERRLAAPGAVR